MSTAALIAILIILFIIYYLYKMYLRPAFYIFKYKKQFGENVFTEFLPHIVSMNPMVRDFKLHKDCYYTYKKIIAKNPNTKAII